MTPKEVKAYLSQAAKLDRRLELDRMKLDQLRSSMEYRPPGLTTGGSGGDSSDRLARCLEEILEYEEETRRLLPQYVEKYIEISRLIAGIGDDTLEEVLERRYLLYQKWEDIAWDMHYSVRRVLQLHGVALKKISLNFTIDL